MTLCKSNQLSRRSANNGARIAQRSSQNIIITDIPWNIDFIYYFRATLLTSFNSIITTNYIPGSNLFLTPLIARSPPSQCGGVLSALIPMAVPSQTSQTPAIRPIPGRQDFQRNIMPQSIQILCSFLWVEQDTADL